MAKRRVEVEVSGTIVLEFDDEAVSDWDGRTLLTANENPERYVPGTEPKQVLAAAAITVGLWGSRDGFADFAEDALQAWGFSGYPEVNSVTMDGERL